jgi:hypothetical protein
MRMFSLKLSAFNPACSAFLTFSKAQAKRNRRRPWQDGAGLKTP